MFMKIQDTLKNKNSKEKSDLKALEIVSKCEKKSYNRSEYKIEIVDIQKIDGGVEVFARAWKGKKQIGFGRDGSVEIERFRIFNPPVLVGDENGDIEKEFLINPETKETKIGRFREDPKEAVLQVIEQNLGVMKNIHLDSNIEKGKVGKTTSTFYPDASPETTSFDGYQGNDGGSVSWSTVRNYTSTASMTFPINNDTGTTLILFERGGSDSIIYRIATLFDTSSLPDTDIISSATLSLYVTAKLNAAGQIGVIQTNPASNTGLTAGDWDNYGDSISSPTEGATRINWDATTSAYSNWTLNATGIGWINKTGVTKLGFRGSIDMDSNTNANTTSRSITFSSADHTGTTQDPKLVVEHEPTVTRRVFSIT